MSNKSGIFAQAVLLSTNNALQRVEDSCETRPDELTLAALTQCCEEEIKRFFKRKAYDSQCCYELFRRAFVERDEQAWSVIYDLYYPLMVGWVRRHPSYSACGEEEAYFVNRAFTRMWTALTPEAFSKQADISSLLRYLKMCVHSTVIDHVRTSRPDSVDLEKVPEIVDRQNKRPTEGKVVYELEQKNLWKMISSRLKGKDERLVIYASFILGLKPREIYEHYPDQFTGVTRIYRIKENVLARLRQDRDLLKLFQPEH